jgi:Fe-S-cluster-containing dehydrogenase component
MMGQFWINIREWERGDSSRRVKTATVPVLCAHCEKPACAEVAKDGAVYKREDGIVIIDPEKSKGQKAIAEACPLGATFWNEELQIPQKCTMCAELLDDENYLAYLGDSALKRPRCVEACPNRALLFGDLDDPNSEISRYIAANRVTPPAEFAGRKGNVVYLNIPTVFLAGTVYLPRALDEVAGGATVRLSCEESGETWETQTNYFGDWEVEWLPKDKTIDIRVSLDGYKEATYTATTDKDRYVAQTYLESE